MVELFGAEYQNGVALALELAFMWMQAEQDYSSMNLKYFDSIKRHQRTSGQPHISSLAS
jgi:hypothetical protein